MKDSLRMTKGDGEDSYLKNSEILQKIMASTLTKFEKAVQSLFDHDLFPCNVLNVADLGCSTGPNTFLTMSTVLRTISDKCHELNLQIPEIQFYLNDLPSNDFNTLFKGVSDFCKKQDYDDLPSFHYAGVPGSFHDRLFPRNSLHLVNCSYAAHWLSKVPKFVSTQGSPLNKGNIYISEETPISVKKSYFSYFEKDFTSFLKSRSEEIVTNGLVFLILKGREFEDPSACESSIHPFDVLSETIAALVSEGLMDQEKLDDFNMPLYGASEGEIGGVVEKEGSFVIEHLKTVITGNGGIWSIPRDLVKNFRVYTEAVLAMHFGDEIMDMVYEKAVEIVALNWEEISKKANAISIVAVLRKN